MKSKISILMTVIILLTFSGCPSKTLPKLFVTEDSRKIQVYPGFSVWNDEHVYEYEDYYTFIEDKEFITLETGSVLKLNFNIKPKSYTVEILVNDFKTPIEVVKNKIVLPARSGIVLFEVSGEWNQGSVSYIFGVNIE